MGSYFGIQPPQRPDTQNRVVYVASGGQTTFTCSYTPGYFDVYQNGVKQQIGVDVNASTGTNFVFTVPCVLGDIIEGVGIHASAPYDFYTKAQSDANFRSFYAIAVGTADALSVTTVPLVPALTDGMEIKVRVASSNLTTTPTVTFSNLGIAKNITMQGNQPVPVGAWLPSQEITLRYNITTDKLEWLGVASYASAAEVLAGTAANKIVSPAALLAQWTGSNQLKSGNGYQKLPGGLILQWGRMSAGEVQGVFPIPYTVVLRTFIVPDQNDGSAVIGQNVYDDTTGWPIRILRPGTTIAAKWFAIGY